MAPIRVTVISSAPDAARRITRALRRSGMVVERPLDVAVWARRAEGKVAVVDVRSATGRSTLQRLRERAPALPAVAVADGGGRAAHAAAMGSGASAVVGLDAPDRAVVMAVSAAADGWSLLPRDEARRLYLQVEEVEGPPELGRIERDLLHRLARGHSIREVAEALGYSERQMHRKARRVYQRLGAEGRAEALVKAAQQGLVTS